MSVKIDLTGKRFNRLVALSPAGRSVHGDSLWLCQCDCGNKVQVKYGVLSRGTTGSCGCFNKEQSGKAHALNLTNQRFGRLLVVEMEGKTKANKLTWLCKCDCGNQCVIVSGNLTSGITKSCGCYRRELTGSKSGENHYNFNKDLSSEERKLARNIPGYTSWKNKVKEVANYTCDICQYQGVKGDGSLVSHHLHNFKDYPHLRTEISNGVCLCADCHRQFHSHYGTEWTDLALYVDYVGSQSHRFN